MGSEMVPNPVMRTGKNKFTEEKVAIFERRAKDVCLYMVEAAECKKKMVQFEMFVMNTLCSNFLCMNIDFMSQISELWSTYETNIFMANVDSTIRTLVMMLLNPPNKEVKLYYHKSPVYQDTTLLNGVTLEKPHPFMMVLHQPPHNMYFFDKEISISINRLMFALSSMDKMVIHFALHDILHRHSKSFATSKSKHARIFDLEVVDTYFVNVSQTLRTDIIFLLWKIVLLIYESTAETYKHHIIPNLAKLFCIQLTKSAMKDRINALFYAYYFVVDQQGYLECRQVWNEELYVQCVDVIKPSLYELKGRMEGSDVCVHYASPHQILQNTYIQPINPLAQPESQQQQQQQQQQCGSNSEESVPQSSTSSVTTKIKKAKKKGMQPTVQEMESSMKLMYLFTAPSKQN
jgi:hypothetical protein